MSRVAVFGAGYVGLVTGACFADLGHDVVIRDVIPGRIERLRAGEIPIYEPGLEELLRGNAERLTYTLDVAEAVQDADFLYVAVGTPPTYSGDADLSAVWTVVDELGGLERRAVMVMKSTVPVGTGENVRHRLDARGLENVGYASNPEFTAEGTAVRDFQHPDRIVIGAFDVADGEAVEQLHAGIDAPVVHCDVASAEMIKLAANAALMTRISFINEIANVCEATGADVVRVAEGIGLDRRIGSSFLRAGIGYGGSCFPKDSLALKQLAANSGYHFQLLNAVIEVNELQKRRVIGKLQHHLGNLRGKTVALLGVAFKPNGRAVFRAIADRHPRELRAASAGGLAARPGAFRAASARLWCWRCWSASLSWIAFLAAATRPTAMIEKLPDAARKLRQNLSAARTGRPDGTAEHAGSRQRNPGRCRRCGAKPGQASRDTRGRSSARRGRRRAHLVARLRARAVRAAFTVAAQTPIVLLLDLFPARFGRAFPAQAGAVRRARRCRARRTPCASSRKSTCRSSATCSPRSCRTPWSASAPGSRSRRWAWSRPAYGASPPACCTSFPTWGRC